MSDYKQIITEALQKVVSENGYQGAVSNRDIHEQSLAHRLAFHLECSGYFSGYNVDCEYNRHGETVKTDAQGRKFRPDIVIHSRGDDANLLMIQTKKFNDSTEEVEIAKDDLKSQARKYRYKPFLVTFPKTEVDQNSILEI